MKIDFLSKIINQKKEEIKAARQSIPELELRKRAENYQQRRSLFSALEQPGLSGVNIIAEIKRASPSKGVLCPDLNPVLYAKLYEEGGAAALSVLTDQSFFHGSIDDLQSARKAVSIPVLRKDFLISTYQIYETAVIGADAFLLIVRILSKEELKDFLDLGKELHRDVLVEVHSQEEIEIATLAGAKLIGINNRNLKSFETSIDTTKDLVRFLQPYQVAVAESGIRTRKDILELNQCGVRNFLIGESLVKAPNPKDLLKELMGLEE